MELKSLTTKQHVELTARLLSLAKNILSENKELKYHDAGFEYTSIMICFYSHIISSVDTILKLHKLSPNWFPTTNAYIILRSIFEINIVAHYISKDPCKRAISYIEYGKILNKKRFDAILKHKETKREPWRRFIEETLKHEYYPKQSKINEDYNEVKDKFTFVNKRGKKKMFPNWTNKSLKEMAKEVNHEIEYDLFYSDLSNFTHGSVKLANRFLKIKEGEPLWSMRSDETDVGFIFRYAATFLSCFLSLFGKEFKVDIDKEIESCWNFS